MTIFSLVETMGGRSRHVLFNHHVAERIHRLEVIQKIRDEHPTVVQAAERLDLSRSQVHRLLRAYDRDGPAGLVSKKRSQPGNRRHSEEFRNAALDLIREHYLDFGPTLGLCHGHD
jgi:transposase-like protein